MKAAVLGSPIAHSLSPVLHAAGYAALGLTDWTYSRFELVAAELPGFLAGMDDSWRGLSLTMPLKEACLEVATEVTAEAANARAGNTLVRLPDGGWLADNTDVRGLVAALRPAWHADWSQAAVLGAGATARSALLALARLGVTEAIVYARNPAKAAPLVEWAAAELAVRVRPLSEWADGDEPALLSTLPGGAADALAPDWTGGSRSVPEEAGEERPSRHATSQAQSRSSGPSDRHEGPPRLVFDAVYAGWPTPLARAAAASGWQVIGGLDLLVHQAALQFELFTGHEAPIDAMFAAGRTALNAGSPS